MVDIAEELVHILVNEMSKTLPKTRYIAHKIGLKRVHKSCNSYIKISETFQVHTIIISITTNTIGMITKPEKTMNCYVWQCWV